MRLVRLMLMVAGVASCTTLSSTQPEATARRPSIEAGTSIIPPGWRSTFRTVRDFLLPPECETPLLSAAPPEPDGGFIMRCDANSVEQGVPHGIRTIFWLDADGHITSTTRQPPNSSDGNLAVAGPTGARLLMAGADRSELLLVSGSAAIERVSLPEIPGARSISWFNAVSPSGRYVVLQAIVSRESNFGEGYRSGAAVLDVERNELVWVNPAQLAPATQREIFSFIHEDGEQLSMVFVRFDADCIGFTTPCSNGRLVLLDVRSGDERSVPLPADGLRPSRAMEYGRGQAIVYLTPVGAPPLETPRVAIADLDTLTFSWSGLRSDAPPPRDGLQCARDMDSGDTQERPSFLVSHGGEQFRINTSGRSSCAVSTDGRRLLLVTPPEAHMFAVD